MVTKKVKGNYVFVAIRGITHITNNMPI